MVSEDKLMWHPSWLVKIFSSASSTSSGSSSDDNSSRSSNESSTSRPSSPEPDDDGQGDANFCEKCNRAFATPAVYRKHMEMGRHKNKKGLYACVECGKEYQYLNALQSHEALHAMISRAQVQEQSSSSDQSEDGKFFLSIFCNRSQNRAQHKYLLTQFQPTLIMVQHNTCSLYGLL